MHAVQLQAILQGLHLAPLAPRRQVPLTRKRTQYSNLPSRFTTLTSRSFSAPSSTSSLSDNNNAGVGIETEDLDSSPGPAVPKAGWLWDRKIKGKPLNRQSLREQNIKPKKSLGQNFMMDESVLEAITAAAAISAGDPVLEVGPGTGALTRHLLDTGAALTAVEKDRDLHEKLEIELEEIPTCQLICADVLKINLPELLTTMVNQRRDDAAEKVQVVANLPYYITKDFLVRALPEGNCVSRLLLMLQDEVAIRLSQQQPGGTDWRAMNIIVHYYSKPKYLFKIDRLKYIPAPKVHGAVVEFRLKSAEERIVVPDERAFLSLVKKAFLQRRKALRNALQPLVSSAEAVEALEAIGLTADARAQELGLDEFVKLAWELEKVKGRREPAV